MKNVFTVAAAVATFALSNVAFAGQPVGAAMVSTKVVAQTAGVASKAARTEVAANQIKSFQWGSTPARSQVAAERVVKAKNLAVKPSVITWPSTTGGTTKPAKKGRGDS
jgi:hypothetical protein